MLNASVGVQRVMGRLRRPQDDRQTGARAIQIGSLAAAHKVQRGVKSVIVASRLMPERDQALVVEQPVGDPRRPILWRLGHDRAVAIAVAGILVSASLVSLSGGQTSASTGGPTGDGPAPRLAVGGSTDDGTGSIDDGSTIDDGTGGTGEGEGLVGTVEFGEPNAPQNPGDDFTDVDFGDGAAESEPIDVEGPFIDDGTLIKPVAVDTTVADGRDLVRTYKVEAGDTLVGIANKFGVSMMSVWWANDLKSKQVKAGKTLRIPPVTGLIVTVAATDTLDGLAAKYKVNGTDILVTNGLEDRNLVVGQVLVVPGAKGKAIPKPTTKPAQRPVVRSGGGGGTSVRPPATYQRRQLHLARGRWRQLRQPVLPLRPLRPRHRCRLRLDGPCRGRRNGRLRRLEEQRRRLPGLDRTRVRPVHDLQPHVGDLGRSWRACRSWRARRARRPVRPCQWSAPAFRSLARPSLGRRTTGKSAGLPLGDSPKRESWRLGGAGEGGVRAPE